MVSTPLLQTFFAVLFLWSLPLTQSVPLERRDNDLNCRSAVHPNPVVLVHGLTANKYDDLYALQQYLTNLGFCTFSQTYGAYSQFPYVGGLKPVASSSQEVAAFIESVKAGTGASKIDLVGHSEGGFLVEYVPKFEAGIASTVDKIVAIAPPSHGTSAGGLYDISFVGGEVTYELSRQALATVGCDACNDLTPSGTPVKQLNSGPIVQSGNKLTIIYSSHDEAVTPPLTAAPVHEAGVRNILVQTECPNDPVAHVGLAFDTYIWGLVANTLDPGIAKTPCTYGQPY